MRIVPRSVAALLGSAGLLAAAVATSAAAEAVRVTAADDGGVTLRVELPAWRLEAGPASGRSLLRAGSLPETDVPGRPGLPFAVALVAIPPRATVSAAVIGGDADQLREGVRLLTGGKPGFVDGGREGKVAVREPVVPIADGPWPRAAVELGQPFVLRGQRVVSVRIHPFRYDEATARLWSRATLLVRISFTGAPRPGGRPAPADRHWDPVLERAILNYEQGRAWRQPPAGGLAPAGGALFGRPPGAAAIGGVAGFDESEPEVRVRIDTTGVWSLDYARLSANGYPANVPVGEVSVHRHEYVEGQLTPYVTVELPIEVDDRNGNLVFDAGDRIVVYVQSWADRTHPTLSRLPWGGGEVIYATRLAGGAGLRVGPRNGWRNNGAAPLASYPWKQRWEKNFFSQPFAPLPADTNSDDFSWSELLAYYDRPDSFVFETNHLDPSRPVQITLALQGRKEQNHYDFARLRNGGGAFSPLADSSTLAWSGRGAKLVNVPLPGTALTEGRTNAIGVWGKPGSGQPDPSTNGIDYVGVNWFDVTYWRQFRALRGYLSANSGDAAGEIAVTATGFTDSTALRAWDVSDSLNPTRLDAVVITKAGGQYTLALQDSVDAAAPRRWIVFDTPKALPARQYSAVTRQRLENAPAADIIYIVPEALSPLVRPLAALRRQEGLDTLVATLESVNDEFNGGRKSDWAIRRFLRYAYARPEWHSRFVLLVGDGSLDPQNFAGTSGPDWIPVRRMPSPVTVYTGDAFLRELVPCDFWYVWALDQADPVVPSESAPVPDLFIGRLPVKTAQQTADLVAKLIAYEAVDTTQTWRRRMLLHSDDDYSQASTFGGNPGDANYCRKAYEQVFEAINQACGSVVTSASGLPLVEAEQFRQSYLLRDEPFIPPGGGEDTCRDIVRVQSDARLLVTAPLLQRLNDGRLWWNYQGHANQWLLAHEYVYLDGTFGDDKASLANYGKPFYFSAFSCHPNEFAVVGEEESSRGPSMAEGMLNLAGRGAIASWASVGFEIIPSLTASNSHLNVWMTRSMFSEPPLDPVLDERGARVVLGEALALTLVRNYAATAGDVFSDHVGLTYELLGDPATRFTVGAPEIVVTANGQPVTDGLPVRLASASDTLRLEADIASNVRLDQITLERTGPGGTTVVPPSDYTLTPAFPDTAAGSVFGGRRFHLLYVTTQCDQSYTLRVTDRNGVSSTFAIVLRFETVLTLGQVALPEGSPVAADANLALLVLSPCRLDPLTDLELLVDNQHQAFTPIPARGDTTGRVFQLQWTHTPYAAGPHAVELRRFGVTAGTHTFRVETGMRLAHVLNFPDPFEEQLGTRFLFTLLSDVPADVMIRVFTVSGRMIWEHAEKALSPGAHEWPWDGLDREGQAIANGVYLYRIMATNVRGAVHQDGRLVKLRRPRHTAEPSATP